MKKKLFIIFIFIFSVIFGSFLTSQSLSNTSNDNNLKIESSDSLDALNPAGTIAGTNITYRYGLDTFDAHDSLQVANNGTATDSYKEERLENLTLDLVNLSSIEIVKFVFRITENVYYPNSNTTRTFVMDNNTYDNYIKNVLNSTGKWIINLFQPAFRTTDTTILTTHGVNLGSFPSNVSLIGVKHQDVNVNITHTNEAFAVIVSHTPIKDVQVQLNYTLSVQAFFAYYNAYNVSYNIHAEQWSVNIRDGNRMGLAVSAFKNLKLNYTEIRYSVLQYYLASQLSVNLTYTNGTYVPFENYPFALRPAYFAQNGTIEDININFVNTTSIIASTTAVQAFSARLSKDVGANAHVDAAAFVAWMVSSTPRLIAFKDVNLDNQLNLEFNPLDGLKQSSGDYIPYIGVLEATRGNAINYHKYNQTYDQTLLSFQGFQFINETKKGVNENNDAYTEFHMGFGTDVDTPPTFTTYWDDPVNDSGTQVFHFGVNYNNFPVSWVNMTDGTQMLSPMNITYDYVYRINPNTGSAKLSPTITYGAVSNSLKTAFDGLSLATMYQSDFLSVKALRATRQEKIADNVTSSRASAFASVSFAGPESNFTNVDTRGGKENYTLDGIQHTTGASILNLASFSGSAGAQNVTTFQSDNTNIMNSAMMKNTTVSTIDLNYRKDLILISYPEWSGGKIVHDPSFSTVYQPHQASPSIISSPADTDANTGDTLILQWQVSDPDSNGDTYKITDETNAVIDSGTWNSGSTIKTSITVKDGVHKYTLTITDKDGNTDSKTVTITGKTLNTNTGLSTASITSDRPSNITTAAPGFTLEVLLILSVVSLISVFIRKFKK